MEFDSISAFLFMEGHGPYVWSCYAVFMLALGAVALWSVKRQSAVMRQQRQALLRVEKRQSDAGTTDSATVQVGDTAVSAASFTRIHPS